jgi:selenoprotein W-related protein
MLRSTWLAQELLSTFGHSLGEVALVPGGSGQFQIMVNQTLVWDRKIDGGFPSAKELKRRVRDVIAPDLELGQHVEKEN